MKTFIKKVALELGALNCPYCGELDYAFGLYSKDNSGGFCYNCNKPIKKHSDLLTFYYSLEILKEFISSYDDFNSFTDKQAVTKYIDDLLFPIRTEHILPANEKILQFQAFLKSLNNGYIGGFKLGGAINMINGYPSLTLDNRSINLEKAKVLGLLAIIIVYIVNFKVKNEFTI